MNGRKAKVIRDLTGVNKENRNSRSYHGTNFKTKKLFHPTDVNTDGSPVLIGTYQTATYVLNQGERLMNKLLKKQYLTVLRNPTKNMLTA